MLKQTLIAAALVTGMGSAASAATVTYSATLGDQTTNYTGRAITGISQFDSSLGTLNSATITLEGSVSGGIQYESLDASGATVTLDLSATVSVSTNALGAIVVALPELISNESVTAFDGTIDFAGTSGGSVGGLFATATNSAVLTGAALAEFIGTGFVNFTMDGTGTSEATGPGNLATIFQTLAGGIVTVTYDYDDAPAPVPLPAGAPLLLLGLGALGVARRKK